MPVFVDEQVHPPATSPLTNRGSQPIQSLTSTYSSYLKLTDRVDANGTCVSFLVSDGQQGVGTIRLVPSKGKLTRLAVLKSHRSYGLGRDLVNALEDYVKSHPGEFAVREEEGRRLVKIKIHSQVCF